MRELLIIIATALLFASCEDELDFRYHEAESQLVIEAYTSDLGTTVALTHTSAMDEPIDTTPITNAEVYLTDLTDNVKRKLAIDNSGIFQDSTPGIVGHNYKIEVSHDGNYYASISEMLPATKIIDLDFQWIKMPYDHVAILQIRFADLKTTDDCYWIKLYRNDEPYMWHLADDRSAVDGTISEVIMTSRKDIAEEDEKTILKDGDIIKAVITPISHSIFDYLTAIQMNSNGPQNFIGDYCLGYYIATSATASTIVFHPDTMPIFN